MNKNEVMDLLAIIDRCYETKYTEDKDIFNDWFKVLKNYELQDMTQSLDTYMKYNTTYAPKVYDLIRGYSSIENKKRLENAKTRCMFCDKEIDLDDEAHIDRCRSIEFIKSIVKRFQNVDINKAKYRNMSQQEFDEIHLKAVKLVVERSTNDLEVKMWKKYLENLN